MLVDVDVRDWTGLVAEENGVSDPDFPGRRMREVQLIFDDKTSAQRVLNALLGDEALDYQRVGRLVSYKYPRTPEGCHFTVALKIPQPRLQSDESLRPIAWEVEQGYRVHG